MINTNNFTIINGMNTETLVTSASISTLPEIIDINARLDVLEQMKRDLAEMTQVIRNEYLDNEFKKFQKEFYFLTLKEQQNMFWRDRYSTLSGYPFVQWRNL